MIYRLPNRLVRVAQASCPPRDRFAVANLFSAKGALSSLAWGNRPRHSVTSATSAEGAVQFEGGHPPWVTSESRFQRWWFSNRANPGASPQVRHGESVLWRTGDNIAPLAQQNLHRGRRDARLPHSQDGCATISVMRTIVVTGSAGLIGSETVKRFAG